jgi:hypothetical protein
MREVKVDGSILKSSNKIKISGSKSESNRILILNAIFKNIKINNLLDPLFEPDILILFEDFKIDPSTLTSLILAFYLRGVLFYLFLFFFLRFVFRFSFFFDFIFFY